MKIDYSYKIIKTELLLRLFNSFFVETIQGFYCLFTVPCGLVKKGVSRDNTGPDD